MTRDQIATVLRALNDECGRLNDLHGVHPTDEQWGVVRDVLRAYHAVGKIRAEEAQPARVEAPLERLASLVRLAALGRAILARLPAPPLDGSEHVDLVDQRTVGRTCVQLYGEPQQKCRACPQTFFRDCAARPADVVRRYLDVVVASVRLVAQGEGVVLTRAEATKRVFSRAREKLDVNPSELVLMSFGDSGNHQAPIAQARRGDGVIVEWYLNGAGEERFLSFRTAFRERPRQPVWGILTRQYAAPLQSLGALSDMVIVSRRLAQVIHV